MAVPGSRPLVSLLMPVWAPRQDWLKVAVGSALDQTDVDLELVVVDDGSEPPVAALLGELSDSRMRLERIVHSGYANACNAAMDVARGDYVRFVDADDFFPRTGSSRLLTLVGGREDVIAYGATLVCDEMLRPRWRMRPHQQGDVVRESLLARFNVRLGGGMLWPRTLLRRTGYLDTTLPRSADWEYIQRALELATVRGTDEVVHHYRRHAAAMTTDIESGRSAAREIVTRYFERHPEQRGSRLERKAFAMLDATAARVYATHGQPRHAAVHLARGLAKDPLCVTNELSQARSAILGRLGCRLGLN